VAGLTEPWKDPDAEYEVLVDLVVPAAQANYDHSRNKWSSLDAKTFGFLAIVAAVIGGLAAAHDGIHPAWWAPATGCAVAAVFFIRSISPRDLDLGPDVIDFHDEMRGKGSLEAARAMVESLTDATENVEDGYSEKGWNFSVGLALLSISLIGCLPVVLFRP
jgi:hypothetical protein